MEEEVRGRASGSHKRVSHVGIGVICWDGSEGGVNDCSGVKSWVKVRRLLIGCHVSYIRTEVGRTD